MERPRIDGDNRSSGGGGGNNAGILWDYDMESWTWPEYRMRYSAEVTILFCIAYMAVFLVGFVGNTSVVLVVYKNVRMRSSPTNIFIVNLAVADLLVIVVCVPFTLFGSITNEWHLGLIICKLVPYFQGVSVNASINTLMAISVERCLSICYPMNPVGKGACKRVVVIIWIVSLTITMPWAIYFDLQPMEEGSDDQICLESWPTVESGNVYFAVANLVLCYMLPLLVIAVCYMCIWHKVSRRKVPGEPMHNGAGMVQRSKMKVITMIFYVVVLFAVSWLPLYLAFSMIKFFTLPPAVEQYTIASLPVAQWLGAANSSINPLLYAIFNQRFREGYRALLAGNLCRALDYSTSVKYLSSRAGTALKRRKRNRGGGGGGGGGGGCGGGGAAGQSGAKPEMRKTIGAIYVHRDAAATAAAADGRRAQLQQQPSAASKPQPSRDDGNRPRSASVKEPRAADEFADSVVQFCAKKCANTFV